MVLLSKLEVVHYRDQEHHSDIINLNLKSNNSILFSFNEYETISLILHSEDLHVEIESYSAIKCSDVYNTVIFENNRLILENDVEYFISLGNESLINYLPGIYKIIIRSNNSLFNYYFKVKHNINISDDSLENVSLELENFSTGLSIDYLKNNKITYVSNQNTIYNFLEIVNEKSSKLIYTISNILNDYSNDIKSVVLLDKIEGRQNAKTLKMNCKRSNLLSVYNVKKISTIDCLKNQLIKKYLNLIYSFFNIDINEVNENLIEKNKQKKEILELINNSEHQLISDNSTFNNKFFENQLKSLNSDLEQCNKWIDKLNNWINSYNKINKILLSTISSDKMKQISNISLVYSELLFTDKTINFLHEYYRDLYYCFNFNSSVKLPVSKRSTYSLFELFGFTIINNNLINNGYTCINNKQFLDFVSDCEIKYVNNNEKVIVRYDHFCNKYNISNKNELVSINSMNCKPDFIIEYYDEFENIKDIKIVEMKYRSLRNGILNNGTNDIDSTIDDYFQLKYYDHKNNIFYNVSDVYVIYPSLNNTIDYKNNGIYIGVNPKEANKIEI